MSEREIFISAYQKADPAERQRFLDEACGSDAALRQRVDALLGLADGAGSFLEQSPVAGQRTGGWEPAPGLTAPGADAPLALGTVIGPYKLLELIGEGGMGAVFMAQQTQPVQRKVALKIIKPGMDSRQVVARFEAERQALALMDHPNIAKVFDGGSTSAGRPYFVMELVKGVPITQYCDDHHLDPKQRLELFVSVCQAVQHAHQKGVIHRDIKPSNVLVAPYDGQPVVKVIDFGIAKATGQQLTEKTLFTGIGAVVGTLEYMSPEQAELSNQDIDTRSDIYSLGVLLYELLTGTTPLTRKRLKEAALLEVLRWVREEDPPRPSTRLSSTDELPSVAANRGLEPRRLTGLVRGDLDQVVMKSLEKDRNRRYDTANGFAADLLRYLSDEPVQASPPSALYRWRKFARRNRAALVTVVLIAGSLVVGTAVSVWQAVVATNARDSERTARLAEGEARDAERIARDAERTAQDEKTRQATQINRELGISLAEAAKLRETVRSKVPTDPVWQQLRETLKAAEALAGNELADPVLVARVKTLLAELKQDEADRRMAARLEEIHLNRGTGKHVIGSLLPAYEAAFREYGLPIFDPKVSVEDAARRIASSPLRDELVAALDDGVENQDGHHPRSSPGRLLRIAQRVDDDPWRRQYFDARINGDGQALLRLARRPGALEQPLPIVLQLATRMWIVDQLSSIQLLRAIQRRYPAHLLVNDRLASSVMRGATSGLARTPQEKLRYAEEEVGYRRAALAARPESVLLRDWLAGALLRCQRFDEAIAIYEDRLQAKPGDLGPYESIAWTLNERGVQNVKDGHFVEAAADFSRVVEMRPKISAMWDRPDNWRPDQSFGATVWLNRARAYGYSGQLDKAVLDLSKVVEAYPVRTELRIERAGLYYAIRAWDKCIEDASTAFEKNPKSYWFLFLRARAHQKLKQWDKAVADYDKITELDPTWVRDLNWGSQLDYYAWFLLTCPDPKIRNPARAVQLAKGSMNAMIRAGVAFGNDFMRTIGVAEFRAGNWKAAAEALAKSHQRFGLGFYPDERGGPVTIFFLAMTHAKLGDPKEARKWYDLALRSIENNKQFLEERPELAEEVHRFRKEAEVVLELKKKM